jgi:hypothetical protein
VYYGGRPEPVKPIAAALGGMAGAVAGSVIGYFAFLLATFFPHLLLTALPGMTNAWFLALWVVALGAAGGWFANVLRGGRGIGTKVFAVAGLVTIAALLAGDLTGTVRVYPWRERFYFVLGPQPDATPPGLRR